MYFDCFLQISGARDRVLLSTPHKDSTWYVLQMHFRASNNAAEYDALLHRLRVAILLRVKQLNVYRDFVLISNHINKEWDAHDDSVES